MWLSLLCNYFTRLAFLALVRFHCGLEVTGMIRGEGHFVFFFQGGLALFRWLFDCLV